MELATTRNEYIWFDDIWEDDTVGPYRVKWEIYDTSWNRYFLQNDHIGKSYIFDSVRTGIQPQFVIIKDGKKLDAFFTMDRCLAAIERYTQTMNIPF